MANPEHLEILERGVEVWNKWRGEYEDVRPALIDADLDGAILRGADFSDAYLMFAYLRDADLRNADLSAAHLSGAHLDGADLRDANLSGADLFEAHLSGAILIGACLRDANLRDAQLREADLSGTQLGNTHLRGAQLRGAQLRGAQLRGAILRNVDLRNADLSSADLSNAELSGAILRGADFTNISLSYTTFVNNDLSEVKGLETVRHHAPSSIGVDTFYQSAGKIPKSFLRGCGVPDEFITYMRSLVATPILFYSCFISYSSKDHPFAERLHTDLQSRDVRCWFAPEDLKIGDRFRDRIDESIRLHDKLLIILSEHSVASPWVSDEVESAIEREHREGRTVLFPIMIDDAVNESTSAWAASIRRTRHIGDFTRWKEHDSYSKAFDRLLRDLKAEE